MKNDETKILTTAYVDNELKNKEELRQFEKALKEDPSLNFDLSAEIITKNILRSKFSGSKTPDGTRKKLLNAINRKNSESSRKNLFKENIYSGKFIMYGTAAVILIAFVLLLFNRPAVNDRDKISQQTGGNNMIVLAQQNFENYLNDKNQVQFISDNSDEIKNYFQSMGVKFEAYIPEFEKYSLVGASVTEHNGVKLAHHYYSAKNGKYLYVFQAHEDYFKGDSIIRLTNDLLSYLKPGNSYRISQENYTTIVRHQQDKVIAMVSNLSAEELPDEFVK